MTDTRGIDVKNIEDNEGQNQKQSPAKQLPDSADDSAEANLPDEKCAEPPTVREHQKAKNNESHRHHRQDRCHHVLLPPGPVFAHSVGDIQPLDCCKNSLRCGPPEEQYCKR